MSLTLKSLLVRILVALRLRRATPKVTAKQVIDQLEGARSDAVHNLQRVRALNEATAASYEKSADAHQRKFTQANQSAVTHRSRAAEASQVEEHLLHQSLIVPMHVHSCNAVSRDDSPSCFAASRRESHSGSSFSSDSSSCSGSYSSDSGSSSFDSGSSSSSDY